MNKSIDELSLQMINDLNEEYTEFQGYDPCLFDENDNPEIDYAYSKMWALLKLLKKINNEELHSEEVAKLIKFCEEN